MNKLLMRSLSGAVYVLLIVGAIALGNWWFAALTTLFAVLGVIEFERNLDGWPKGSVALAWRILDVLAAVAVVNLGMLVLLPSWLLLSLLVLGAIYPVARFTLALYDKSAEAFRSTAWSILSIVYIAVPMLLLQFLYTDRGVANHWLVLAIFIMIWLNDTGAFLVGSSCGRLRLFERLSPKKSWEGFFGGFAFCLIAGAACSFILPEVGFSLPVWVGLGAVVSIFSTWGDLFESLMKRSLGVKDSGNLIPGHGGILDRIDSLLFVAWAAFIYYNIFG